MSNSCGFHTMWCLAAIRMSCTTLSWRVVCTARSSCPGSALVRGGLGLGSGSGRARGWSRSGCIYLRRARAIHPPAPRGRARPSKNTNAPRKNTNAPSKNANAPTAWWPSQSTGNSEPYRWPPDCRHTTLRHGNWRLSLRHSPDGAEFHRCVAPASGPGRRTLPGVWDSLSGVLVIVIRPALGCSTSTAMCRCCTCGSWNTWS